MSVFSNHLSGVLREHFTPLRARLENVVYELVYEIAPNSVAAGDRIESLFAATRGFNLACGSSTLPFPFESARETPFERIRCSPQQCIGLAHLTATT